MGLLSSYVCTDPSCSNMEQSNEKGYCPECGQPFKKVSNMEAAKISKTKKDIKNDSQYILFTEGSDGDDIMKTIYMDMANLASHEAGTKWMRIGTLLSLKPSEQMLGAGFKAVIDQNKILIKQNELIFRELKKLNSRLE